MDKNDCGFQLVSWVDVRDEFKAVNPELANIIDKISPTKRYSLIKASYRFGDLIVKDGVTHLSTANGLTPVNSNTLDPKIVKALTYAKIPLALLLSKASEIFVYENERIIPLNIFFPGTVLGTFETLNYIFKFDCSPIWNVSAGGRLIFTLPKITEVSGFNRLKTYYNIPANMHVSSIADHWEIFKQIASHSNFDQEWKQELLFFTAEWFNSQKDPAWLEFREYIFKQGWTQSQYAIAKFEFGIFWQDFVKAICHRKLKPTTYLSDSVKHILAIAMSAAPGVTPADNSQLIAPTDGIKNAIVDIYQLKNYLPTIMHSGTFGLKNVNALYYSLNLPTLLEGTPEGKRDMSLMVDLKAIKLMFETLQRSLKSDNNPLKGTKLDYFHVEKDKHNEIKPSTLISEEDARFLESGNNYSNRIFCATSQFWRGCIRIAKTGL